MCGRGRTSVRLEEPSSVSVTLASVPGRQRKCRAWGWCQGLELGPRACLHEEDELVLEEADELEIGLPHRAAAAPPLWHVVRVPRHRL